MSGFVLEGEPSLGLAERSLSNSLRYGDDLAPYNPGKVAYVILNSGFSQAPQFPATQCLKSLSKLPHSHAPPVEPVAPQLLPSTSYACLMKVVRDIRSCALARRCNHEEIARCESFLDVFP
jgi:hypothetical protein